MHGYSSGMDVGGYDLDYSKVNDRRREKKFSSHEWQQPLTTVQWTANGCFSFSSVGVIEESDIACAKKKNARQ